MATKTLKRGDKYYSVEMDDEGNLLSVGDPYDTPEAANIEVTTGIATSVLDKQTPKTGTQETFKILSNYQSKLEDVRREYGQPIDADPSVADPGLKYRNRGFFENFADHASMTKDELMLDARSALTHMMDDFNVGAERPDLKTYIEQQGQIVKPETGKNLRADYAKQIETLDTEMDLLDQETSFSKIGKIAPYIALGATEGTLGRATLGPLKLLDSLIANKTKFKGLPKLDIKNPFYKELPAQTIGAIETGLIESGINPDAKWWEDPVINVLGGAAGVGSLGWLREMPEQLAPFDKSIIDWAEREMKLLQLSPGTKLGVRQLQQDESKKAGAGPLADIVWRNTQHNQNVINHYIGKFLGIETGNVLGPFQFTEDVLFRKYDEMGKKFDDLSKNTSGQFTPEIIEDMLAQYKSYSVVKTPAAQEIKETILPYIQAFSDLNTYKASSNPITLGEHRFDGDTYQAWSSQLKREINKYYSQPGKQDIAKALQDVKENLDTAMKVGVEKDFGSVRAGEWDAANTDYAMMDIMMKYGLDGGNVDAGGLHQFFKATDNKRYRTMTEEHPDAIYPLFNIAKLDEVRAKRETAQLGGVGFNTVEVREEQPISPRAKDLQPGLLTMMEQARYESPTFGPGSGLSGKDFGAANIYGAATAQGVGPHQYAMEVFKDPDTEFANIHNSAIQSLKSISEYLFEEIRKAGEG